MAKTTLSDSEDEDVAFFDREDTNTSTIKNDNNNSSFVFTNKKKYSTKINVKSHTLSKIQMDIRDGLKDISSHSKKKRERLVSKLLEKVVLKEYIIQSVKMNSKGWIHNI